MDHVHAVLGVVDLRMELYAVEAPLLVRDGHVGAGGGMGSEGKARRHLLHVIAVAHPGYALLRQAPEELAAGVVEGLGLAVLPGGVLLGGRHPAAQSLGHELAAVADAQHGHPHLEKGRVHMGGLLVIDGVGTAGEDKADGLHGLELGQGGGIGLDLAVDAALAHAPGDELVVLAAKVQDDHGLMGHVLAFFLFIFAPAPGGIFVSRSEYHIPNQSARAAGHSLSPAAQCDKIQNHFHEMGRNLWSF